MPGAEGRRRQNRRPNRPRRLGDLQGFLVNEAPSDEDEEVVYRFNLDEDEEDYDEEEEDVNHVIVEDQEEEDQDDDDNNEDEEDDYG